ncbi:MAG TPA: 1,4-dihydroxy-2-naphthoate octaprenyltransferase, partial [Tenacibaculum sp.]|nr:1,4-dihydroxy-2-naphthoate octaprenyltransferase [Tenacibaculum sp.]
MRNYIKAARLRTLPLSVSGIIVGASIGFTELLKNSAIENLQMTTSNSNLLQSSIFWLAILTTIGFQVLSNFANDYGDGIKGTDDNRKGETRMVSSGAISPNQMKRAIVVTSIISILTAILLIYEAFGEESFGYSMLFLFLGLASIVAAIKYTVGEFSYGYSGFGDLFVFLFFG